MTDRQASDEQRSGKWTARIDRPTARCLLNTHIVFISLYRAEQRYLRHLFSHVCSLIEHGFSVRTYWQTQGWIISSINHVDDFINTAWPACNVHGFGQRKLTLQVVSPLKPVITLCSRFHLGHPKVDIASGLTLHQRSSGSYKRATLYLLPKSPIDHYKTL